MCSGVLHASGELRFYGVKGVCCQLCQSKKKGGRTEILQSEGYGDKTRIKEDLHGQK